MISDYQTYLYMLSAGNMVTFFWLFFRCEATNEADNLSVERSALEFKAKKSRPAAEIRIFVQYAPSVSVQSVRPGMVEEGNKVNTISLISSILIQKLVKLWWLNLTN